MNIIQMLKGYNKQHQKDFRLYIAYSENYYKIGQTAQKIYKRFGRLREMEKDIDYMAYIEFQGSLALALFVESTTRLYLENIGYTHIKNDHYKRVGDLETFTTEAIAIATTALNDLKISYKIIYKQAE